MKKFKLWLAAMAAVCLGLASCSDDDDSAAPSEALLNVTSSNSLEGIDIYGATINIDFDAQGKWICSSSKPWATVKPAKGDKGASRVSLTLGKNSTGEERSGSISFTVEGFAKPYAISFTQSGEQGSGGVSTTDKELNQKMHDFLKECYLFREEYNTLSVDVSSCKYTQFLNNYLLGMSTNEEDGGRRLPYMNNAGERYIYSTITKVGNLNKAEEIAHQPQIGTGLGTFFSTPFNNSGTIALVVGYVFEGAPAQGLVRNEDGTVQVNGLQRGDMITSVNGVSINRSNYNDYVNMLFQADGGQTFKVGYYRFEPNYDKNVYELVPHEFQFTSGEYFPNPVIYAAVMKRNSDDEENMLGDHVVGYLVYQSFSDEYHSYLRDMLVDFKNEGVTDVVLDLRHNMGGSVPVARYLTSSLIGPSYDDETFVNMEFSYRAKEVWKFNHRDEDSGDLYESDYLGDLRSIKIIVSEETASSSELVINALRGLGYNNLRVIGSKTEGKNVGFEVQSWIVGDAVYQFSPITFRATNCLGEGDYKDGIAPDDGWVLNNENASYDDDIDEIFPYSFGNWDVLGYNRALAAALHDVIGQPMPDFTGKAAQLFDTSVRVTTLPTVGSVPQPIMRREGDMPGMYVRR